MEISGYCEEKFGEVKKAFEKNLNDGSYNAENIVSKGFYKSNG